MGFNSSGERQSRNRSNSPAQIFCPQKIIKMVSIKPHKRLMLQDNLILAVEAEITSEIKREVAIR